jgi:mannose/fructose/N-acetylgalactosamine-specific phosphotransferase system component IIB
MNSFYRVDNRLVHGQIISTWMPHLRVKHFLIVSDTVPNNQLQMTMFRMAIPNERAFHSLTVLDAAKWLNDRRKSTESIMVLFESIADAARLFESGHPYPVLNIGNIHHESGKRQLTSAVYLSEEEVNCLQSLFQRGLRANIQTLPSESPIDLQRRLKAG